MLNKIEYYLITPHLIFTQIFQLQGYEQYGLHGSIVNVPTNVNVIQTILRGMLYEDYLIFVFLEKIRI
jgi:hypothetical protein